MSNSMSSISNYFNVSQESNGSFVDNHADVCQGSDQFWQSSAVEALELYAFPLVIVAGSLMNVLAVVVLQTRTYRGTSTGFLLTALSLADLGLLLTGILRKWVMVLTDYVVDVRLISSTGCKVHIFLTYLFQYLSSWTLSLITIERAICVCVPFRCKELFSFKKSVMGWVAILVSMAAINAHFFWTYDKHWLKAYKSYDCHGLDRYSVFLYGGPHNWLDLVCTCFAPFAVIIVCNVIIICKLAVNNAHAKKLNAAPKKASSTTVMLFCVSVAFLLLISPFTIFTLGESYKYWTYSSAYDCAKLNLVYSVTYLLFNVNSAVNFLLYCVTGSRFRRCFVALFHWTYNMLDARRRSSATSATH